MYNRLTMGEITLFHLSKQTKAIPQKGDSPQMSCSSTRQQALCAFMADCASLCPSQAWGALCLSHPHDHGNLTAEANESHSWSRDAFPHVSSGESSAGCFTQVLDKSTQEALAPHVKNK